MAARTEKARILVEIRGALKAAADEHAVAEGAEEMGDELRDAGRDALFAAGALALLQRELGQTRREQLAAGVSSALLTARTALFGATAAGVALSSVPALVSVVGALGVIALTTGAAIGGLGLGIGLLAAGAVMQFKATADAAGTAANRLKSAAGSLKEMFGYATATGADAAMLGLAQGIQRITPLIGEFRSEFTAIGQAAGQAFRQFFRTFETLGPEIGTLLRQLPAAIGPLGQLAGSLLTLFVRLANVGLPPLIDGLTWLADKTTEWSATFTGGKVQGALSTIGSLFQGIGRFVSAAAREIGPVLGPAAETFATAIGRVAGPLGTIVGSVGRVLLQLATAALPGITRAIRTIAPLFQQIGRSKIFSGIGKALGDGIAWAAKMVVKLVAALKPAEPFFTNVLGPLAGGVIKGLGSALEGLVSILGVVAQALGKVGTWLRPLRGAFETVGRVIGTVFAGGILKVIGLAGGPLGKVLGTAGKAISGIGNVVGRVVGAIGRTVARVGTYFAGMVRSIAGVVGRVSGVVSRIVSAITSPFRTVGGTLVRLVTSAFGRVVGAVRGLPGKIAGAAAGLWDGLKSGLVSAINWIIDRINDLIGAYNSLPLAPNVGTIGRIGGGGGGGAGDLNGTTPGTSALGMVSGGGGRVVGRALGGVVGRGEITAVGERGIEIAEFPPGTRIHPHNSRATQQALRPAEGIAFPDVLIEVRSILDGREVGRSVDRGRRREIATA